MAKQANTKMIGGFVVVAVSIMATSVVIFGSRDLFKETLEYVLYFEETVKGLNVGAPVMYQGVQVGSVKRVAIRTYLKELKDLIPVFVEIYPESIEIVTEGLKHEHWKNRLPELIDRGLRAQLVTQSLITGQLVIEMGEHPDTPIVLKNQDKDYEEIPTIPSTESEILASMENFNLQEISARLISILTSAERILKNPDIEASLNELKGALGDVRGLVQNLNSTLTDARGLVNNVDQEIKPLAGKAKSALDEIGKLARDVDGRVGPLSKSLTETLKSVDSAFKGIDGLVGKHSPTRADLDNTLKELAGASRSLQVLTDYLSRHPEALIKGKGYSNY